MCEEDSQQIVEEIHEIKVVGVKESISSEREPYCTKQLIPQSKFSGSLPSWIGKWKEMDSLLLANNRFTGEIPREIEDCPMLKHLSLASNLLTGSIPRELEYFDASENWLSGEIPTKICGLPNLVFLNLAKNNLGGEVPRDGLILGGMIIISVFVFSLCKWVMSKRVKHRDDPEGMEETRLKGFVDQNLYFLSGSRSREPLSINVAMFEQPLLKVSLGDIVEGTDHFCKKNIIGDGGFGTVYKTCLPGGKTVAVKKLSEAKTQGNREFMAEMETLGKVKHPNLVSLLGYCSFSEEKLLVYEYMVNGSLDHWLRNQTGILELLDWSKRLKIAVGAARGLAFLHHGFLETTYTPSRYNCSL
ncbi:PREDICTED: leucine-rich repeat receptor protein kinase EMS1-like [Camelina sativa]|uniref:Leucine-rich repeat receptor protein kinase EMS1-like n=1 Tax=Camelina sativa TaxID=90675 RepID=A0ABM0TTQ1_CAMSA|nr:PREDICTED: leucine-rich repeat receptor protein kinase EMS1-like [Camelina sativa]